MLGKAYHLSEDKIMLWLKSFHIVAMVSWFAAIFYLPRLFVYHAEAKDDISIERFKIMERRLYRGIMWPAAIVTTLLGFWMLVLGHQYYLRAHWMHAKLGLVFLLWGYHLYCGRLLKHFKHNKNRHSALYFRVFNEVPVIFLVLIVILVVVKPF